MITYIVTVKQEVVHEHVDVFEITASTPEEAREKAENMLANGALRIEHHLAVKGFIRDPEVTSVDAIEEFDEAV